MNLGQMAILELLKTAEKAQARVREMQLALHPPNAEPAATNLANIWGAARDMENYCRETLEDMEQGASK